MMELEPLPCPFCGSAGLLTVSHPRLPGGTQDTLYHVECELRECGCRTNKWYPATAAVQTWNRRVQNSCQITPPKEEGR